MNTLVEAVTILVFILEVPDLNLSRNFIISKLSVAFLAPPSKYHSILIKQ